MASTSPVASILALFMATFRAKLDDYQVRAYSRSLDGIPADVLFEAADGLINAAAGGRKFYPLPTAPDVKGACAEVMSKRRNAAARLHLDGCEHSGHWIDEGRGMTRCPCWTQAMRAMETVGERIALPPAPEESEVA